MTGSNAQRRLTREFLDACVTGYVLPDKTIYVATENRERWALAVNVGAPTDYGWGWQNFGGVGRFIEEKNSACAHGHTDWRTPTNEVGEAISKNKYAEGLHAMFAEVDSIWLGDPILTLDAKIDGLRLNMNPPVPTAYVLYLRSDRITPNYRNSNHSVIAARRLVPMGRTERWESLYQF